MGVGRTFDGMEQMLTETNSMAGTVSALPARRTAAVHVQLESNRTLANLPRRGDRRVLHRPARTGWQVQLISAAIKTSALKHRRGVGGAQQA
jgi:hypothetical protein